MYGDDHCIRENRENQYIHGGDRCLAVHACQPLQCGVVQLIHKRQSLLILTGINKRLHESDIHLTPIF